MTRRVHPVTRVVLALGGVMAPVLAWYTTPVGALDKVGLMVYAAFFAAHVLGTAAIGRWPTWSADE